MSGAATTTMSEKEKLEAYFAARKQEPAQEDVSDDDDLDLEAVRRERMNRQRAEKEDNRAVGVLVARA